MFPRQTGLCRYSVKGKAGTCSSFRILPYGDEKTLQAAVASVGPVAVAINARLLSFHFYRGGEVQVETYCPRTLSEVPTSRQQHQDRLILNIILHIDHIEEPQQHHSAVGVPRLSCLLFPGFGQNSLQGIVHVLGDR